MKRYIRSSSTYKIKYELLGWLVDDNRRYKKIWLDTWAVSKAQAMTNFRNQVHRNYPGWSIVEDKVKLREYEGNQANIWPKLSDNAVIVY